MTAQICRSAHGVNMAAFCLMLLKEFRRIAEIGLETSDDGHWVLASVANGDGGDFAHYLRDAEGRWQQLTHFEDGIKQVRFGRDGALYLLSHILCKKGLKRNGRSPTLLYGYGGYSVSLAPGFDSARRIWFDAGGVYVVANLRGGGEYGEQWHRAGNLTHKQHVFDDFIAAAEHLIKRRYTNPSRLTAEGASNGGLLTGAFLIGLDASRWAFR